MQEVPYLMRTISAPGEELSIQKPQAMNASLLWHDTDSIFGTMRLLGMETHLRLEISSVS